MPIPESLAADLAELSAALDDPSVDLTRTLDQLSRDAGQAVASYIGLTVHIASALRDADFTVLNDHADLTSASTSLRFGLASPVDRDPVEIALVFYASAPGAFVDLAADLAWLAEGTAHHVALDDDLPDSAHRRHSRSLGALSAINQAIGVLLGRGHTQASAETELLRLANGDETGLGAAAAGVLADLDD